MFLVSFSPAPGHFRHNLQIGAFQKDPRDGGQGRKGRGLIHGDVAGASSHSSVMGLESLRLLFLPRVKGSKHLVSSCWKETEHGPANNRQARMSFNYAALSLLTEEGTLRHTKLRM